MNIPINFIMWLVAFIPIITLIFLLVVLNKKASQAAIIGVLITIFIGYFFYRGDIKLISFEILKGVWSSITILLIIFTAILLYQVGNKAEAFYVIKSKISRILPNELLVVLALGWVFESFLQGITGFGVPVAVGAPLLIGIGVKPLYAVVIPLLGQSWGNTFGTLAAAWDALAISAKLNEGTPIYLQTAFWAAIFFIIWIFIIGFSICWFYGKKEGVKKGFLAVIILTIVMGIGQLLLTQINTTLATFIPAALSLLGIILIGRLKYYRNEWRIIDSPMMNRNSEKDLVETKTEMTLLQAFLPYIVLSALTLFVLTINPINNVLSKFTFGISTPETVTGYGFTNPGSLLYSPLRPFTHASFFLLLSALFGLIYYISKGYIKKKESVEILNKSVRMALPSSISVVCLIVMSRIMGGTGQTLVLAEGIANTLGMGYLVLAPFVGLLGTFMTGSNMSSNILFGEFQMTTANILSTNLAMLLAAQTTGGSIGSAISPSNIVLGTTTANIIGQEGRVLKKLILLVIPVALLFGLIVYCVEIYV